MKEYIKKHFLIISFVLSGAIAGFLYWRFIGCMSGACMIKSKWYLSTLYGMLFGYVAGSLLEDLIARSRKTAGKDDAPADKTS